MLKWVDVLSLYFQLNYSAKKVGNLNMQLLIYNKKSPRMEAF